LAALGWIVTENPGEATDVVCPHYTGCQLIKP